MTDKSKNNNDRKRQIILGSICLFVVLGSLFGSIAYNMFNFPRLNTIMGIFSQNKSLLNSFAIACIIPYAILILSMASWVLILSMASWGIPVSLILTAFQSFICSWYISSYIVPSDIIKESVKYIPANIVILFAAVTACYFSVNKITSKFISKSKYKSALKREKTRKNMENIIIFFFVTIIIFLYCIIKEKTF